jgi:hypothetical protein
MNTNEPAILGAIEQYKRVFGKPALIVRPGLSLTLYSATGLQALGPHIAKALELYLVTFPEAVIDAQLGTDKYKAFGMTALKRLLSQLRSIPSDYEFLEVHLKDGVNPQCGRYAMHFEGTQLTDPDEPLETNLLVFEWPFYMGLDSSNAERIIAFCKDIVSTLPFSSGNCGFAFHRPQTFPTECLDAIQRLMPRFHGFDPSYRRCRFQMRNHLPTVQWLTVIGPEMSLIHPGLLPNALRDMLGVNIEITSVGISSVIKAATLPLVIDSNRPEPTLESIPEVARALLPWRYKISAFGGPHVDAEKWLARFDSHY